MRLVLAIIFLITLLGCAAKQALPGAETVMLSNDPPANKCKFLGEAVGGQGNWWTDDITSTKNVVEGARNDLRNSAYKMGANYVHIQQSEKNRSYLGGSTLGIVGHAYYCG